MQYPFERINLPSNGQCYTSSLSCGRINLYPLTAKHEDILCSPGLFKDYTHFDILLKDIIENNDVGNIDDLLLVDVQGILLAAKMLSFGPKQQVKLECPHCEESDEYIVNLSDFRPVEVKIPSNRIYNYKDYVIHFGVPTYGLFKSCIQPSDMVRKLIVRVVDKDGNNIDVDIFLRNKFLYRDYQQFKKFLDRCFPHITPDINVKCSYCDQNMKIPFNFGKDFFGMDGSYKIKLHKEIFAILYSSNGGFSHQDVYNLPINLRMVYIKELMDTKKKEQEKSRQSDDAPSSRIHKPPISK